MKILSRIFKGFDTWYLIKSYILSIITFVVILKAELPINIILGSISVIIFPFATIFWDEVIEEFFNYYLVNRTVYMYVRKNQLIYDMLKLAFFLGYKIMKIFAAFIGALLFAPIGFTYMYFKTKPRKSNYRKRV